MPYEASVAARLQSKMEELGGPEVSETRMFGGFGYLVNGNMCCGTHRDSVIFRLGLDAYADFAQKIELLRPMDLTGRVMRGWGMANGKEIATEDFGALVGAALEFARSLPPKQ